jgi:hypothetical protein
MRLELLSQRNTQLWMYYAYIPSISYLPTNSYACRQKSKVASASPAGEDTVIHTTPEGEKYIDLGKKKRATVRTFKGLYSYLWHL